MVQKHSTRLSWDDMEAVLMVGRYGTVRRAAQMLGVAHTTVAKKVADAEARLGLPLFVKTQKGYQPTEEGQRAIHHAEQMAEEMGALTRHLGNDDAVLRGEVHVSANASLLVHIGVHVLAVLQQRHPEISIRFSSEDRLVGFGAREADIVLRMQAKPADALFGRRLCAVHSAVYAKRDTSLIEPTGVSRPVVGWDTRESVGEAFRRFGVEAPKFIAAARDINIQAAIALSGVAAAELPCYIGDKHRSLMRVSGSQTRVINDLWILTHESLKMSARIRATLDALVETVMARRDLIEGRLS